MMQISDGLQRSVTFTDRIYIHPDFPSQHIFVMANNVADQLSIMATTNPWMAEDISQSQ